MNSKTVDSFKSEVDLFFLVFSFPYALVFLLRILYLV